MGNHFFRGLAAAFGLLGLAAGWASFPPAAQTAAQPDPKLQPYVNPGVLADLGNGRRIHVLCMGRGSPTVILSAGMGNWAETWKKVQPVVAAKTRVCAWDRAGYGFSSPSPDPQDVTHTTADLERALKAAKVAGPYVMVGHSLGGLETLLFVDRNLRQVAGVVLEDPTMPGQTEAFHKYPALEADIADYDRKAAAQRARCLAELKAHNGDIDAIEGGPCMGAPPSYPKALWAALRPSFRDPAKWETRNSLVDHFGEDPTIAIKANRNYGGRPLIILMATKIEPTDPGPTAAAVDSELADYLSHDRREGLARLAAASSRGEVREVPDSTHYIHDIRPELVISTVDEAVDLVRRRSARP